MAEVLRAVASWAAGLVGLLAMGVLLELGGDAVSRASTRTKTVMQVAWWLFTVAAAIGSTLWFQEDPASDLRLNVAMFSWVGLPMLGLLLAATAGAPPAIERG